MGIPDDLRRKLSAAHAEALRVGDSSQRADQLARTIGALVAEVSRAPDLADDTRARLGAALADAERVLRRDDDGREAGRHLQAALRLTDGRIDRPFPF